MSASAKRGIPASAVLAGGISRHAISPPPDEPRPPLDSPVFDKLLNTPHVATDEHGNRTAIPVVRFSTAHLSLLAMFDALKAVNAPAFVSFTELQTPDVVDALFAWSQMNGTSVYVTERGPSDGRFNVLSAIVGEALVSVQCIGTAVRS